MKPFPLNRFCVISLSLSVLMVTPAVASDFQSPRTAALGGAGHAGPLLTDAIYLNPSFSSFLPAYTFSLNYGFYNGGNEQPDGSNAVHGHILNASIQDGRSELFQAGVGLTLKEDSKVLNVGASKAVLQKLGVGFGGKFIFPNSGNGSRTQDMNVSTTYAATDWLQVMAMVDNLLESVEGKRQNLYREYIVGSKVNIQGLALVYIDPHLIPTNPYVPSFGYEAGIELTPMKDLFFRFGMFRNSKIPELQNAFGRGYGFGVGWVAPKLSLDYGLKRSLAPLVNNTHEFSMTVYY